MNHRNLLIAGDLMWGLSGDPSTHPIACDVIGAAVKRKVSKTVKPTKPPVNRTMARVAAVVRPQTRLAVPPKPAKNFFAKTVAVAKKAAVKSTKQTAKQRAQVAKQRLATRPPAKVAKAKVTAARLKSLPPPAQKKTVAKMAELMVKLPAPTSKPVDFLAPTPTTGPNYSPVVQETQPWDLPGPTQPTEELSEEFQDVADAVWADQAYDFETTAEEPEEFKEEPSEDDELDEPEEPAEDDAMAYENEIEEMGVDLVGWNPFSAIKKGIQKGASFVSKVAKSDLMKATAAGLAVVYPPVGAPLSTTLPIAAGIADAVKSKDPKKRAAAVRVVKNTAALAKKGDPDAGRALSTIAMMSKLKSSGKNDAWRKAVIRALAAA